MEVTLYIDTCNKELSVGLSKYGNLVYKKQYLAYRKQSEFAGLEIDECLKKTNTDPKQLTRIVVSNGPGSYTGIRIGLTLAKVMASVLQIQLITLSSLNVMAGLQDNVLSFIDARSKRVYAGFYDKGLAVKEDQILTIEQFNKIKNKYNLIGDLSLFNKKDSQVDIIENMFLLAKNKVGVENIDTVKAIYLKDEI